MMKLRREAFRHTAYFCEENIWWLARSLADAGMDASAMQVMLFTNPRQAILLFNQREAPQGRPVVWDYHVILRAVTDQRASALDLDTRLDFPCPYDEYLRRTFPPQSSLPEEYQTWVRSIPADSYLRHFHSDRSHMRGRLPRSGFPDYPVIRPEPNIEGIDLREYRDMQAKIPDGSTVHRLAELYPEAG